MLGIGAHDACYVESNLAVLLRITIFLLMLHMCAFFPLVLLSHFFVSPAFQFSCTVSVVLTLLLYLDVMVSSCCLVPSQAFPPNITHHLSSPHPPSQHSQSRLSSRASDIRHTAWLLLHWKSRLKNYLNHTVYFAQNSYRIDGFAAQHLNITRSLHQLCGLASHYDHFRVYSNSS